MAGKDIFKREPATIRFYRKRCANTVGLTHVYKLLKIKQFKN
jgi:hypothetical protein